MSSPSKLPKLDFLRKRRGLGGAEIQGVDETLGNEGIIGKADLADRQGKQTNAEIAEINDKLGKVVAAHNEGKADNQVKFTVRVNKLMEERIYSAAYNDFDHRSLNEILNEVLERGFAGLPKNPPAPETFIARFKIKGRSKKT